MNAAVNTDTRPERLVELRGLVTGYDRTAVVRGIDLHVDEGEVVVLLGANGAGKTTTLLSISGMLPVLAGSIWVLGEEATQASRVRSRAVVTRARRGLAHVPEDRGLFFDLTTAENLRLGGSRRSGSASDIGIDELLGWFPALGRVVDQPAGLLSGGEQQMLALARAMRSRPRVLMVDEMSLGLAPIVVERVLPVLRRIADEVGTGVLVVEQHVALVLSMADRAYLMDRGRILASGDAAELAQRRELIESGYFGENDTTSTP